MLNEILSRRTLYQAFERIRDNGGCRGADGVSLGDFADNLEQELDNLQDRLIRRVYHPYPLLRFEIPKSESKVRALCVPAVRDRVLQTAVYLVTRPLFEAAAHDKAASISAPPPGDKSPGYVAAPPEGGFKQRCYGACSEGTILRA